MTLVQANRYLRSLGYPGLFLHKAEGVWYLLGDDGVVNPSVERCLHVVRRADITAALLRLKVEELTDKKSL